MLNTVCIIDIDTTIANNDHRAHYVENGQKDWDSFLQEDLMGQDTPQDHACDVIDRMRDFGYQIVFLTGRNVDRYDVTAKWLEEHFRFNPNRDALLMRTAEYEGKPASVFKEAAFLEYAGKLHNCGWKNTQYLFFEDHEHVLQMWQRYGLVFKCPEVWQTMNPERVDIDETSWRK